MIYSKKTLKSIKNNYMICHENIFYRFFFLKKHLYSTYRMVKCILKGGKGNGATAI